MIGLGSLKAGWELARVFGPMILATVFFLLWQSSAKDVRFQKVIVTRVTGERDELIAVVTEATVQPDKQGRRVPLSTKDALAAQRGIIRDRDSKGAALATVSRATKANVATDVAARSARVVAQTANEKERRRSAPIIRKLDATVATGNAGADTAALEAASKTAWEQGL